MHWYNTDRLMHRLGRIPPIEYETVHYATNAANSGLHTSNRCASNPGRFTLMPATEVITSYHDLWRVEQSFRMSKSDLAARPMFARTRDAVEAHLTIVFTALAISREVQTRTGLSLRRFLRTLKPPLRSATIDINGVIATYPPALNPPQVEAILDALKPTKSRH